MAQGYGAVTDSGFIGFAGDLQRGAWGDVVTKKWEGGAEDSAASLLGAPAEAMMKLLLRGSISRLLVALGATSLVDLDAAWDSSQRRLFHRIAEARDSEDPTVRAAADRLAAGLLPPSGGTEHTNYDLDAEVDFGEKQCALTSESGPLHADVKKTKLENALADVKKTTEALAKGVGRLAGEKRKSRSIKVREALSDCVTAFNTVHETLHLLAAGTPKGAARDHVTSLMEPLDQLLARHVRGPSAADAVTKPAPDEAAPEDKAAPEKKPA